MTVTLPFVKETRGPRGAPRTNHWAVKATGDREKERVSKTSSGTTGAMLLSAVSVGQNGHQVEQLIAGSGKMQSGHSVMICNQCVGVCAEMVAEHRAGKR